MKPMLKNLCSKCSSLLTLYILKAYQFIKTNSKKVIFMKPILITPADRDLHLNSQTAAAAAAKSLQSYPTLFDRLDGSPPGSPVPGILQARTLEWVAISFSNA